MTDAQTIEVYNQNVERYRELVDKLPDLKTITHFVSELQRGALVLDLGCGVGTAAAQMRDKGLDPVCVDASSEMVKAANDVFDLGATVASFAAVTEIEVYDAVWANFTLLHATKADFPGHIAAVHRALKQNGLFFIALKTGHGERRDAMGRYYAYYTQDELVNILTSCGFKTGHKLGGASRGMAGSVDEWVGIYCRKQ
jgi:predicted TPR repeat methyltransferase